MSRTAGILLSGNCVAHLYDIAFGSETVKQVNDRRCGIKSTLNFNSTRIYVTGKLGIIS